MDRDAWAPESPLTYFENLGPHIYAARANYLDMVYRCIPRRLRPLAAVPSALATYERENFELPSETVRRLTGQSLSQIGRSSGPLAG
jgi:hypothetical protein